MKSISKLLCFLVVFTAIIAAFCTVSFAATLNQGTELPTPEDGWKRVSFEDHNWTWEGDWTHYGKGATYNKNAFQKINFTGDRIRLLDASDIWTSLNHEIYVDGIKYSAVQPKMNININVVLDLQGLENMEHSLIITTKLGDATHHSGISYIDIAETATVRPFNANILNLKILSINSLDVDLSWNSIHGATSYIVKRSNSSGGPYEAITTTSAIAYSDTNVTSGTTYYYIVSATVNGVEGPPSNEVSAVIPQPTNKLKLVLEVKQEKQLSVSDELSDNADMDWTSSEPSIATVDTNGMVKALKPGNTVITSARKDSSYTETINVLVVDLEYQLAVDLSVGDTCRLTIDDLKNTTTVTWSSYDPTIATVSAKGKVTAVSEGLTYVVANDKDGKEIGRIYIRVRK